MQQQFEFNAPKYYNFLGSPNLRNPNDFFINLTDPNDYWFMVTHVQISPHKENDDEEQTEEIVDSKPVRRSEPKAIEENVPQRIANNQPIPENIQPDKPKRKTIKKVEPIHRETKPIANNHHERGRRTVTIENLKQIEQKGKVLEYSNEKKVSTQLEKQSKWRHKSMGYRSKSRKDEPKISRPCPFPPRIQREWQKESKRDWYSLSPQSKIEAEKKMGEMKQSKELKGNPEKKKEKKELRFKF